MLKVRQTLFSLFFNLFLLLHILAEVISRTNVSILAQFASNTPPVSVRGNPNYDGRALTIPLDLDGTLEMYQHWMDQAFSGMFAAVANQKLSKTNADVREEMGRCSKQVNDVISHANCVSKLLRGEFENKKSVISSNKQTKKKSRLELYKAKGQKQNYSDKKLGKAPREMPKKLLGGQKYGEEEQMGKNQRRMRREIGKKNENFFVKTAPKYFLHERTAQMSPLGAVAQLLTKSLMAAKNKTETAEWQSTIEKIRQNSKRRKAIRKQKTAPEKELMKLQRQILGGNAQNEQTEEIPFGEMDEILERGNRTEIRQIIRQAQRQKAARRTDKKGKMDPDKLVQLVRQGVTLGFALAGQNTTGWDEKTMRLVSPRFLSVVAEEEMATDNETLSLLSPSLLSMHDEGQGIEKLASLPSIFRSLNLRDQQQWLNLIMEAAGINEQAKKMTDEMEKEEKNEIVNRNVPRIGEENGTTKLNLTEIWTKSQGKYEKEIRGEDGQPMYFTRENVTERYGEYERRKIDLWEKFMSTFSEKQKYELNRTGFVPMRPEQLRMIYGVQSPFNDTEALHRLSSLNDTQIREGMEKDIHNIARLKQWRLQYHPRAEVHSRRRRAVVLSPIVASPFVLAAPGLSQAVVLSPVVLSPVILTPAVFGPFILSPWVFVPVILSPRLLSPFVVNPWIFSPIVLSPLVLHPLIVAPGIFNPIVLSPLVLSPLILAPQVFTPVILSPLVLNPLILTPMVGSPLVLSPFVLSPLILSPQALFALVLSPYALSPIIESKLIATALILSPSWLS